MDISLLVVLIHSFSILTIFRLLYLVQDSGSKLTFWLRNQKKWSLCLLCRFVKNNRFVLGSLSPISLSLYFLIHLSGGPNLVHTSLFSKSFSPPTFSLSDIKTYMFCNLSLSLSTSVFQCDTQLRSLQLILKCPFPPSLPVLDFINILFTVECPEELSAVGRFRHEKSVWGSCEKCKWQIAEFRVQRCLTLCGLVKAPQKVEEQIVSLLSLENSVDMIEIHP